ncbi:unnamed protein product, partial [Didymodactylos carnosus]
INDSANASHVLSGSLLDLSSSFCINYHLPQSITTNSTSPDLIAFDSPPPPSRTLTTFPQSNGLASNVLNLNGNTSTILQGQTSFINSFEATNIFDEFLACSSQHTNLEEAYKDDTADQEITDQENLRKDVVKEILKTKPKRPLSEARQTESSQKTQKK